MSNPKRLSLHWKLKTFLWDMQPKSKVVTFLSKQRRKKPWFLKWSKIFSASATSIDQCFLFRKSEILFSDWRVSPTLNSTFTQVSTQPSPTIFSLNYNSYLISQKPIENIAISKIMMIKNMQYKLIRILVG